jgi:hypothetical protein
MSKRDRTPRAADEARPVAAEKVAAEKKSGAAPKLRPKPAIKSGRVKVVWEVCSGTGKVVKTYPYPDKSAAEAQIRALTKSTGRAHLLRATKVPMD